MLDNTTREVTALIAVVALAMVAIAVHMLPSTRDVLERRFSELSLPEKKTVRTATVTAVGVCIALMGTVTWAGICSPSLVIVMVFWGMVVFVGCGAVAGVAAAIRAVVKRRRPKDRPPSHSESLVHAMMASWSLSFFVLSVLCNLSAMLLVSLVMLDIEELVTRYDFSVGRWLLLDGMLFFAVAFTARAFTSITGKRTDGKTEQEPDDSGTPEA